MTFDERELETLSDYFANAPVALHMLTSSAIVMRANRAELETLGYQDSPEDYLGHDLREFVVEPRRVDELLDRLAAEGEVQGFDLTLVRRDGGLVPVRVFASGRRDGGRLLGDRAVVIPQNESRTPRDLEVYQGDTFGLAAMSPEEKQVAYRDLKDFFQYAPVALHIVGADGRVQYTSARELESMGYAEHPEEYIGHHIAEFHAEQAVIDEMLENLVSGAPLVDHRAKLRTRDGRIQPVFIYSSSRMSGDSFVNTRCFTFPLPEDMATESSVYRKFTWPRNEEYGLNAEPSADLSREEAMSLALRYIAGRKRPEETLGFLAECSRVLGGTADLGTRLEEVLRLTAGYVADLATVDVPGASGGGRSWSAAVEALRGTQPQLVRQDPEGSLLDRALASGTTHACLDARAKRQGRLETALQVLDVGAVIVAPILVRGEVAGALTLARGSRTDRTTFGPADLALAEELARRLAPELEIARLRGELRG
ncbi:MAG TPA: PAS domain-containing protein [Thermoanaerobaculia bacterium]|nr:PAS domain-containing protein [Thermoanaerobaculia bacterium]